MIYGAAMLLLPLITITVTVPATYEMVNRYRKAVLRLMMTRSAPAPTTPPPPPRDLNPAPPQGLPADVLSVPLEVVSTATVVRDDRPGARALLERMTGGSRRALRAFWIAGLAGAMGGAAVLLALDHESWPKYRTQPAAVLADYLMAVLMLIWPAALTHPLLAGAQGRAGRLRVPLLALGGAIAALIFVAVAVRPEDMGTDEMGTGMVLFVAALLMLSPTVPLLILNGRDTRAVGPVTLCALTTALMGFPAAGTVLAFARYKLGGGAAVMGLAWAAALVTVALAGYLAWRLLAFGVSLYERKKISDRILLADVHWIILTLWVGLILGSSMEDWTDIAQILLVPLPFVLYKLTLARTLRPLWAEAADAGRPLRLLMLRVFGAPERSEELFEGVAHHWRHVGSIQLIAGADLAAMTIEPHEAVRFLGGRLSETFVSSPEDLAVKWDSRDLMPDPDGRYRVNEFFCHDDTWQSVLLRLLSDSDVVLMDLRGFTPQRQGCVFELHRLVDAVPLGRILLLVDQTTDVPFLARVLQVAWEHRAPDTPNADAETTSPLRLFHLPPRPTPAETRQLVRLLADAGAQPAPAELPREAAAPVL
jgi:hypothetical protein